MPTFSADDFRARAKAGQFIGSRIEVLDASGRVIETGTFRGVTLGLTGPYAHDPRYGVPTPDYPGPGQHVPFYGFSDKADLILLSSQTVRV